MYRILICHSWKRDLSRRRLRAHWRGPRARLVLQLQERLGYVRYVQTHQVWRWNPLYLAIRASRSRLVTKLLAAIKGRDVSTRPGNPGVRREERWDVVEELAFASERAASDSLQSSAAKEALDRMAADDALRDRLTALAVTESVAAEPKREAAFPRVATLFFLRSRPQTTQEQMLVYWGTEHKELVISLHPWLWYSAYNQLHGRREPAPPYSQQQGLSKENEPFDGVAELAYSSQLELTLRFLRPSTQWANLQLVSDELNFLDHPRCSLVYGRQYRLFDSNSTLNTQRV